MYKNKYKYNCYVFLIYAYNVLLVTGGSGVWRTPHPSEPERGLVLMPVQLCLLPPELPVLCKGTGNLGCGQHRAGGRISPKLQDLAYLSHLETFQEYI